VTSTSGRLTLSDPDAQGATFVAATDVQGKYGQLMINADGDWTYFLNNALDAVQALGAGETLRDVITVATTDGTTHDIDITVSGLDEPPSFDDWVIAGADASSADGPTVTLVSTGTGDVSVSEAEAFLGLADGALTQAIGGSVFTGSVASADVTVSPGSALKFTFDLTGEDGQFAGFPDAAFVVINGEVTVLGTLGGSEIFDAQTNLTLPSGSYSVGFGVFDVNDNAFAATLSVTELVIGPPGDPIVLDLDGDGVELGGAARFDLDADGAAETLGWVSGGDGLLVVDRDGSGVIEDGREVLSEQFDGFGFGNSVEALRALDTNLDGQVDARDAGFDDLLVWRDQDGDGQTDIGELISLDDLDITSLSVTPESTDKIRDGQVVFAEGAFTYSDGREGLYAGVRFQEQTEPSDLIQPDPILAEGGAVQPRDFGGQAELLDILAQEADAVVEVPSA